jgi:small subunit ribosomal protein S1
VEEGLEGLIHISELSNQRVAHPGDVVKEGEVLKLKIISLDSERHRLGLSLKQAEDRPSAQPAPAQPQYQDRPRRERRDRRDRDYRPEDAIREPDEGIEGAMAAAFAESGLLDQFRTPEQEATAEEPEAAQDEPVAEAEEPAAPEEPGSEPATEASAEEPAAIEVESPAEAEAETPEETKA